MKIKSIVLATHNSGKLKEIQELFRGIGVSLVSAEKVGVKEEPVEDGKTFSANALKKARFLQERKKLWVMADDSGLCVDALGGAPGVLSARWAGEGAPGHKWVEKLLSEMKGIPESRRSAYFETAAVLLNPDGRDPGFFMGKVFGTIACEARGVAHPRLPYDTVFIPFEPRGNVRTFAQMSPEDKNKISHRAKAFLQLRDFIKRWNKDSKNS